MSGEVLPTAWRKRATARPVPCCGRVGETRPLHVPPLYIKGPSVVAACSKTEPPGTAAANRYYTAHGHHIDYGRQWQAIFTGTTQAALLRGPF